MPNPLSVQQRAVAAAQVFQVIRPVTFENLRVVAADGGVIEHDVAIRVPPHDHSLAM